MIVTDKSKTILIFVIAFFLRMCFIYEYSTPLAGDELDYDRLTVSLLNGEGYISGTGHPTAGRPPLYILFLAIIFLLVGKNYFFVRFIQAIFDSLLCVFMYYFGKQIFGKKVAILASFFAVMHLGFIAQPAKILTEGLSTFILFITMIFFYKIKQNPHKIIYYVLTGVFLGATSLIRSNFLIMFFLIAFGIVYDLLKSNFNFNNIVKYLTIYSVAFVAIILPWTIRNYIALNAFVPISTLQGIALYASYKPLDGKIYGFTPKDEIVKKARSLPEVEQNKFLTEETFKLIKSKPAIFFKLIWLKMAYLFSPFDWELIRDRTVYNYLFAFYFPFFLIGSFTLSHRFNELTPIYLPIFGVIITAVVFFGIPRFRVPVEPYMILLASSSIIFFYERILHKKLYISFLCVLFLLNFLGYFNSSSVKDIFRIILEKRGIW